MHAVPSKTEAMLLVAVAVLSAVAFFAPPLAQSAHHHDFADGRILWGVLYAMDVYSNVPFALAGLAGAWALLRAPRRTLSNMQRAMAILFFAGLGLVAMGSATYHLDPHDATLALDRFCMAVAFAGLLGLVAAGHIGERAGAAVGIGSVVAGCAAVEVWSQTGNVLPWAVFQFGGMAVLWWMATLQPRLRALQVNWALVLLAYGAAKLLETNDHAIYELTSHWVSGHSLKHVVASMAAWPVISAIVAVAERRQNAVDVGVAEDVAIRWWRNA
jgi:hypothetical protein